MNDKRLFVWGLAALCGAVVLWQLWPELTRPAPPLKSGRSQGKAASPKPVSSRAASLKTARPDTASPQLEKSLATSPAAPAMSETSAQARVRLNSANLEELQTLPGIGPTLARRIVAARPFASVDDLGNVSGIGPTLMSGLEALVEL